MFFFRASSLRVAHFDKKKKIMGALSGATCGDFSTSFLPLFLLVAKRAAPRDTEAGLVYPDAFCADILSYKIAADIHRISIEMAADVAAAIGRRAPPSIVFFAGPLPSR